ncbi:MAG: hypothetical protein Q8P20_10040 [bacterium]|nr:hypothetical protein [bacterium]
MQKSIIVIVSLAIIAGIIIGGWYLQQANIKTPQNEKQIKLNSDVSVDIPSGWQTYNNEAYNFQLGYPPTWNVTSCNLDKFAPIFNVQKQALSFDIGIFDNKTKLTANQWIDKIDFFNLKQYEDPDAYVAHGISAPVDVMTTDNLQIPVYFGGSSGGGSTGTAIITYGEKIIVFAYSLPNFEERETTKEVFKNVVKTFKFGINKEK